MPNEQIHLTQGYVAFVDAEDFEWLNKKSWYYKSGERGGYAQRSEGIPQRRVLMHREILERQLGRSLFSGEEADHINGNALDNRRGNLRIASRVQNLQNRKAWGKKVKLKGVRKIGKQSPWSARIYRDGQVVSFNGFETKEKAAAAYDMAARLVYGDFARLNFPGEKCRLSEEEKLYIIARLDGADFRYRNPLLR